VPGGDDWDPHDPKPDRLCELLLCLEEHGVPGDRLRETLKHLGVDLDGLLRCLRETCRPGGHEDPKKNLRGQAAIPRERLVKLLSELKTELER
jgi:hypothetical protein